MYQKGYLPRNFAEIGHPRTQFMSEISVYDPEMIIWVDESGCDRRNSLRKFAYTLRGMPPTD